MRWAAPAESGSPRVPSHAHHRPASPPTRPLAHAPLPQVDPIAEEWAARLAAQREGREYVPATPAAGGITGSGAGGVPNFAMGGPGGLAGPGGPGGLGAAPAEEDFDGFGGFEDPQEDDDDDEPPPTGGWGAQQTPPPMGGMGGMGGSVTPAASTADWGDIGMLGQPGGLSAAAQPSIDYGQVCVCVLLRFPLGPCVLRMPRVAPRPLTPRRSPALSPHASWMRAPTTTASTGGSSATAPSPHPARARPRATTRKSEPSDAALAPRNSRASLAKEPAVLPPRTHSADVSLPRLDASLKAAAQSPRAPPD